MPRDHPLAHVDGPTNAVVAEGNFSGRLLFQGAGAGDGPTASAVVADLIDIARGDIGCPFSVPVDELQGLAKADAGHRTSRAYLRFTVADRPGVLAEVTTLASRLGVNIYDLEIAHSMESEGGVLVMVVPETGADSFDRELVAAGYHVSWSALP